MLLVYFILLLAVIINVNFYVVWFIIEIIFLFFLLYIVRVETKRAGLIIYYFFQSFLSLFLFIVVFFMIKKLTFLILCAKLGLFPFFYWVILVSRKLGSYGNIFVLSLQKIPVFWLFWLVGEVSLLLLFLCCYGGLLFVTVALSLVRDLWLLLVYSSIANTGILLLARLGNYYFMRVTIYLRVVVSIIYLIAKRNNYQEILLVALMFLVIPPFVLFFIKLFIMLSIESLIKLRFFIFMFDVFILFYYFTFIFIKFILFERRILIYFINYILILGVLLLRNCVTLIVFH